MIRKFFILIPTVFILIIFVCSGISASAANNSIVYNGSYSSTVIDLWQGLINNNVGKDYVAFRSGQYEYYIFFGEDFEYINGTFSGTGTYYRYYSGSYNIDYEFSSGIDSFSVNSNGWYLYTNVSGSYPSLSNERGLVYEQVQIVALLALLFFGVMRWIFNGR